MKFSEKIYNGSVAALNSAATLLKVALLSKKPFPKQKASPSETLLILGNGPSLRKAIDSNADILCRHPLMAVNFAANAEDFRKLRPRYYILADSHFFTLPSQDANVEKLWDNLGAVDWNMTLLLPAKYKRRIPSLPDCIDIGYYNLTPAEGFDSLSHTLYDKGLAMPRPRNVMIPAIMSGIRLGYKKIAILGADHTWSQSLWVDDKNRVVSVQPHFYKDNEKELSRVALEYAGYHIHDIYNSLAIAFRSYHHIGKYAAKRHVQILNATPGSFIDAFPRIDLSKLNQ